MSNLFQVQLEDCLVTVDGETMERLKDPDYAKSYLLEVKKQFMGNSNELDKSKSVEECTLWRSSKSPTEADHSATLTLLYLRRNYEKEFADKKTHKNEIWQTIANKMNEMNFFVGEGISGREKVRQKFANLQSTYIKYNDAKKNTGEGKLKQPKYFEELNDILGYTHKAQPIMIIDSANNEFGKLTEESDVHASSSVPSRATPSTSGKLPVVNSRFENVKKSVRPKPEKQMILQEILQIQRENQIKRKEEFSTLMSMFQEQNQQKHMQVMGMIDILRNQDLQKKKRSRSSSDEED